MGQPYLEIKVGNQVMQVPIEHEKLTIGRHAESDIVLDDAQASRHHCMIERVGGDYILRDLGSKNGTMVNGRLISSVVLSPNDVITIGQISMKFVSDAPGKPVEQIDYLSPADVVDAEPPVEEDEQHSVAPFMIREADYEQGLEKLADALADRSFNDWDIELINARGSTVHQAGQPNKRRGRREAVELFRLLLLVCFRSRASDIHVEPRQDCHQIRLRIDGTMVDVLRLPNQIGIKLTTLVKVLSDIDIAQRNTIQEGHFVCRVPSPKSPGGRRRVDYRVSFAPAVYGQKLVIRILDTASAPMRISDLHLPAWMFEEIGATIRQDSGMVLVAGPTGSGKTTTLYALVRSIETTRRNVVTIEDPVEIQIENVTQIPVDEAHDRSFSQLLRSVLRQDPDVLLVGEIRDSETARTAMQAAITGHLVLSTVHTQDTIGTIFRLLDLGVEPYLVAQGLHVVVAQRLIRKLCPYCKKPVHPTPEQLNVLGQLASRVHKLFVPKGCARCLGTGFFGRQAFFELLTVNDQLRDVILRNPTLHDIQAAIADGRFTTLSQAAYKLVAEGICSFEEAERIVGRQR